MSFFLPCSWLLQLKEADEKSCKLQTQLSVSHNRLAVLQRKKEQVAVSQQQLEGQRQLLAEVEALKHQLTTSQQTDKRKTDLTAVRTFSN